MKGEFYVCRVILWNPHLRARIASLIGLPYGGDGVDALLTDLRGSAALAAVANRLRSDMNEVFTTIKTRLAGEVGPLPKRTGVRLTAQDLTLFRNSEFIRQVAARLDCQSAFSDVLERLFEPEELQALLVGAGIGTGGNGATVEQLFWRLLTPDGGRAISAHLGGIDVWSFLESFLREEARERLCSSLDCSATEIFARLAALAGKTAIDPAVSMPRGDETQALDLFGVEKLKEMLRALSSAYLHQACETAKGLRLSGVSSGIARLFPLLNFYGRRNYRSGISSYLGESGHANRWVGGLG